MEDDKFVSDQLITQIIGKSDKEVNEVVEAKKCSQSPPETTVRRRQILMPPIIDASAGPSNGIYFINTSDIGLPMVIPPVANKYQFIITFFAWLGILFALFVCLF